VLAAGCAIDGGGATEGGGMFGMFGVYEVSKVEGALVLAADAEFEVAAEIEVLDLISFASSSALLTSRSSCSLN
jgi:hypothetical protein